MYETGSNQGAQVSKEQFESFHTQIKPDLLPLQN